MDLYYAIVPNFVGVMVRIYREPFYDGNLEKYEYGVRNSFGNNKLSPRGVFTVMGYLYDD